jgi:DNA modification methylase
MNQLYYGDSLQVLREQVSDASVDLIYLDPPFDSTAGYKLLFQSAQERADEPEAGVSEDAWHWNEQVEGEFAELSRQQHTHVANTMAGLRGAIGENDMMAYLTMLANRLLESRRVLASTGSLYLHCDPLASHYLRLILDAVFGKMNFRNEISWRRAGAPKGSSQGWKEYRDVRDVILFYTRTGEYTWNRLPSPRPRPEAEEDSAPYIEKSTGRKFQLGDLTAPPGEETPHYQFLGVTGYWRYGKEMMVALRAEGRIVQTAPGATPGYKRYLDEISRDGLPNDWSDIRPAGGIEPLIYPGQKPRALLERIIAVSSNPDDMVLDLFCGSGTTLDAAQKLKRRWIGIDTSHLALSSVCKRLKDRYKERAKYEVIGAPEDAKAAGEMVLLDKYQFKWWALSLVNAQPTLGNKKADRYIDGIKFFHDLYHNEARRIVVMVKARETTVDDVRALDQVRMREKAEIALFLSLDAPRPAMVAEAATAGLYSAAKSRVYPRVQLLTIEGLLKGTEQAEHPDYAPEVIAKRQKRSAEAGQHRA